MINVHAQLSHAVSPGWTPRPHYLHSFQITRYQFWSVHVIIH